MGKSGLFLKIVMFRDLWTLSMWPGVTVTPTMSNGASDGRYLRTAGIPVYGISGIFTDMDDVRAYGKD